MTDTPTIRVRYESIDHFRKTRRFATLAGAQRFAHHLVGPHPDISETFRYAVSDDGIGKVTVEGATLADIFPPPPESPALTGDDGWDGY